MIGIDVLPSNSLFWVRRASRTSVLSGCLVSKTPVDISILMGLTWVSLYLITSSAGAVTGLEWDCVREAPPPSAGRSVRTTMASQHYWASVSLSLSPSSGTVGAGSAHLVPSRHWSRSRSPAACALHWLMAPTVCVRESWDLPLVPFIKQLLWNLVCFLMFSSFIDHRTEFSTDLVLHTSIRFR